MKFGFCLPNYGPATSPDALLRMAQVGEAVGYDSLWTTDHVLVPRQHSNTFGQIIEALISLGYLAGVTEKVALASSIIVLPQRDPILTAKQVAAIDLLSGGRMLLGVGVGWMEDEFRFLRTDFRQRGRMMDEWIQVMRTLWTEAEPSFQGKWIQFEDAVFAPRPLQPGGPPIHIGGGSDAAIRRAATLGDGWHPTGIAPDAFAEGVKKLREWSEGRAVEVSLRARVGIGERTWDTGGERYSITGAPSSVVDQLGDFVDAGLEHLVCYFNHRDAGELLDQVEAFASHVMPALRDE